MYTALGLGSNVGDKIAYIDQAINIIEKRSILLNIKQSSIYRSEALLKDNSPATWDVDFVNKVIIGMTSLGPYDLLDAIKQIEQELGRINRGIWAPREIDIDILLYGDLVINSTNLTIPHKELLNRDFFLVPLAELIPGLKF